MVIRPHPTALLLHPLTLSALALMVVNDGWLRVTWPNVVTGKISDAAALIAFPGVLVALWGASMALLGGALGVLGARWRPSRDMGWRVLFGAVALPAGILVAINVSPAGRDAYLRLLDAVDLFGWGPFHYTLDPTDLWALPASGVPLVLGAVLIRSCPQPEVDLS